MGWKNGLHKPTVKTTVFNGKKDEYFSECREVSNISVLLYIINKQELYLFRLFFQAKSQNNKKTIIFFVLSISNIDQVKKNNNWFLNKLKKAEIRKLISDDDQKCKYWFFQIEKKSHFLYILLTAFSFSQNLNPSWINDNRISKKNNLYSKKKDNFISNWNFYQIEILGTISKFAEFNLLLMYEVVKKSL